METPTSVIAMSCCSCNRPFSAHAREPGWRQRSAWLLDEPGQLFVYLCGRCAARFSTEAAVMDFLDASLDEAVARRNTRRAQAG